MLLILPLYLTLFFIWWQFQDVIKIIADASGKTINRTYAEYTQHKLNEKGEKTGKTLGKHVISLYSTEFLRWLKSEMLNNYSKMLKMTQS